MNTTILTPENRKPISWAGGTSTEIFIYPPEGSFANRDFLFRISTATVEVDESDFTFFEGITRHLMILRGELELTHDGRYSKKLKPYDQDTFSGEWKTKSKGKVTDFNLMLKGNTTGTLHHINLGVGNILTVAAKTGFYFLFLATGSVTLQDGRITKAGDLVQVLKGSEITLKTQQNCDLIEIAVEING